MKLFLDDIRVPTDCINYMSYQRKPYTEPDWVIVRNYNEFVKWIVANSLKDIELISFDHDLADEHYDPKMYDLEGDTYNDLYRKFKEKTGYEAAKWLVEYCMNTGSMLPRFICHSMNPVGKLNIVSYLENYEKHNSEA